MALMRGKILILIDYTLINGTGYIERLAANFFCDCHIKSNSMIYKVEMDNESVAE